MAAKNNGDPALSELVMIRKLLMVALVRNGLTQAQLGALLGLSQQQVSAMFPSGAMSSLKGKTQRAGGKMVATLAEPIDG